MFYKVKRKYPRGPASDIATFGDIQDARLFAQAKVDEDARLKVENVVYEIWDVELLEEFSSKDIQAGGGQQRSSGQVFSPTPFATAPRPHGIPQNWKDVPDDEKEK